MPHKAGNSKFQKVSATSLFVSEPSPGLFGNPLNEPNNKDWTSKNWLTSRFHFSFAEYADNKRTLYGVLRVLNDDIVQPRRGFARHPHRDMEIVSYVIEGKLSHQDSMGSKGTLGRGSVQYMTAGTGVVHSEVNKHPRQPLRLLQVWIEPRSLGLRPCYGSVAGDNKSRANKWAHLVTDAANPAEAALATINQDANIYAAEVDEGQRITFEIGKDRMIYLVCIEGDVSVAGSHGREQLVTYEAARIAGVSNVLDMEATQKSHLFLIEMKKE